MDEKDRLLEELDQARQEMHPLLAQTNTDDEIYPGWTIKDVLAHIAGWDDASIASLQAHAGGDEPGTPASRGIDFYNAQTVSTRQDLSFEQVKQEWQYSRKQFKEAIEQMPPEKLIEPLIFPWGGRGTIAQLVEIFAEHEQEHAREIRNLLDSPKE